MNPSIASTTPTRRILPLVIGIILFGILIGIRDNFATRWQRSLVTATAAVVLTVSVALYRKNPWKKWSVIFLLPGGRHSLDGNTL